MRLQQEYTPEPGEYRCRCCGQLEERPAPSASPSRGYPEPLSPGSAQCDITKLLVTPCKCTGRQQYIHQECLEAQVRITDTWLALACPRCQADYKPEFKRTLARKAVGELEGRSPVQHASALVQLATVQRVRAKPEIREAVAHLDKALPLQEEHLGKEHVGLVKTLTLLAKYHGYLGDGRLKKELLERARKICEVGYGAEHPETAFAMANLANAHGTLYESEKMEELLLKAVELLEQDKQYGCEHLALASMLEYLGVAYKLAGQAKAQRDVLERALTIKVKHFPGQHIQVMLTQVKLAKALDGAGEVAAQRKMKLLQEAYPVVAQHYGRSHLEMAKFYATLGHANCEVGNLPQMRHYMEKALAITLKVYGENHPETAKSYMCVATALGYLDLQRERKMALDKVLRIQTEAYGDGHVKTCRALSAMAKTHLALKEPKLAVALLDKVLQIKEQRYGVDHIEIARSLKDMVRVHLQQAQGEKHAEKQRHRLEAKQLLERTLLIKETHYGSQDCEVGVTLVELANLCEELGQGKERDKLLQRATQISSSATRKWSLHRVDPYRRLSLGSELSSTFGSHHSRSLSRGSAHSGASRRRGSNSGSFAHMQAAQAASEQAYREPTSPVSRLLGRRGSNGGGR